MSVLIAGAGPVGLAAANVLADADIAVTVLEAEPRLPVNLRASTFQPPTLDLLARFGAQVTAVEQDADGVTVTINGAEQLRADWLIGADGGRSRVREALGIPLEGFTWPERFLVASTPFDFAQAIPRLAEVSYFADPQEWFFLLRVRDVWRAMFPARAEETEADILSDASIERRLQRVHAKSG